MTDGMVGMTAPSSSVSLSELSRGFESLSARSPPVLKLLCLLQNRNIDLRSFCRAVRTIAGEGILLRVVTNVQHAKKRQLCLFRWSRVKRFAQVAGTLIVLYRQIGIRVSRPARVLHDLKLNSKRVTSEDVSLGEEENAQQRRRLSKVDA